MKIFIAIIALCASSNAAPQFLGTSGSGSNAQSASESKTSNQVQENYGISPIGPVGYGQPGFVQPGFVGQSGSQSGSNSQSSSFNQGGLNPFYNPFGSPQFTGTNAGSSSSANSLSSSFNQGTGYGPGSLFNSGSGSSSQAGSGTSSFNNGLGGASNTGASAFAATNAQTYNQLHEKKYVYKASPLKGLHLTSPFFMRKYLRFEKIELSK